MLLMWIMALRLKLHEKGELMHTKIPFWGCSSLLYSLYNHNLISTISIDFWLPFYTLRPLKMINKVIPSL